MKYFYRFLFSAILIVSVSTVKAQRFEWMEIYSGSTFGSTNQLTRAYGDGVFTAGEFRGSISFGSTVLTSSTNTTSIYVAKYDTLGNFQWAVKGGSNVNSEMFKGFAVDQHGNLYVSGQFVQSTQWGSLSLNGASSGTSSFTREGFIVKLDPNGSPQWIKGLYSPSSSFSFNDLQKISIADSTLYFGGILSRSISIQGSTFSLTQSTSPFFSNIYIGRLDLAGNVVSLDKVANTSQSSSAFIGDIQAISNTDFAISGVFRNGYTFGSNNRSVNVGSQSSLIVAKFSGTFCDWATSSSTTATFTSSNLTPQLELCANGDIAVAGLYRTSLTIQGQTITPTLTSTNSFTNYWYSARFDNTGSIRFLKGYDISGNNLTDITENKKNELILIGSFSDSLVLNGNKRFSNGGNDILILNLDDQLDVNWFQTGGGGNFDYGLSVTSFNSANVYVLGTFNGLSQFGSTFFSGVSTTSTSILIKMSECGTTPIPLSFIGDTNLCQGQSLRILANPTSASTFQWLNNNSILTGEVFRDLFTSSAGNYSVIVNGSGCVDTSRTVVVNVGTPPIVSLTLPDTVCQADAAFQLSGGLPTGGNYSGDGVTSNQFDPSAAGIGRQRVVYTFSNGGCADSAVAFIYVKPAPTVFFAPLANVCITSSPITLSNAFPFGGTFIGNGVTGNQFDPATAGGGAHPITYTYTDGNGCSASRTRTIIVDTIEIATFATVQTFCSNDPSYTLIEGQPSGGIYQGAGVSNGIFNPAIAGSGTFTIDYIISDANGCTATANETVTVNPAPTVTLGTFSSVCEGSGSVALSGGLPSGGTYSGVGVSGTQFDPTVSGVGTFKIYYDYTDGIGCSSRDSSTITVDPLPVVSLSNDTAICDGSTVSLTAAGGTTYLWSTSATTSNISVTPATTTKYYVTVTGSGNCSSIDSVTVTVSPLPSLSVSSNVSICLGDTVQLSANSSTNNYLWSTNETTPSITVSPLNTTQYIVQTNSGLNCVIADTITVTVNTGILLNIGPDVILDAINNTSVTYSARSGFSRYLWQDNSTGRTLTVNYDPAKTGTNDTISVIAFNSTGCPSVDTAIVSYDVNTGIDDGKIQADVLIYPNPVIDEMIIDFNDSHRSDRLISIYDLEGRLVFQMNSSSNNTSERIRLGNEQMEKGVYTVTIKSKGETSKRKILIQ